MDFNVGLQNFVGAGFETIITKTPKLLDHLVD